MSRTLGQILRFGVVGVTATTVHYVVLRLGTESLGLSPVLMTGLAFCCAVSVTYLGQTLWVFQVTRRDAGQLMRFSASVVAGLLGNMGIMALVVNGFGGPYQAGFLAGLVAVPILTFFLNKHWVFAGQERT